MNWNEFRRAAEAAGFVTAGQCSSKDFICSKRIVESQPKLAERRQLRFSPQTEEPWVKSIAVLLYPYRPSPEPVGEEVFVDSYYCASNAAYHAAAALEQRAKAEGRQIKANVSYPAKEAAVRAGLGIIGRNGLLITREAGTRVVIILMATDFESEEEDNLYTGAGCLDCGACITACPSGALDERGMSHPERCMRNYMLEGVVMPEHLRPHNNAAMIGCDICQRVCPMQPKLDESAVCSMFHLDDYMTLDQERFSASVQRLALVIGRNAARPQRVRAQAALIAGNMRNPAYLPVLQSWSESPFEAVRIHACWAMEQISDTIPD